MLGIVFSILHFKHFTFGWNIHIITDHKPLIMLFEKILHATSPRLNQMLVQILDYNIEFHHQKGSMMHLSDALNGTLSTLMQILSGFKCKSYTIHLSRKEITLDFNFLHFVANTNTSYAIFTTPSRPSTIFLIQDSKISVAFESPVANTLYK